MQLIKDQQVIDNEWRHVADGDALPVGKVTVSLARWQDEREALITRGDIGLRLSATAVLDTIKDDLQQVALIAIEFVKFNDGRGFSLARLLRERYGYTGEIRAIGILLQDQLYYMQRCGFNAFELPEGQNLPEALKMFKAYTVINQPDVTHKSIQAGPWR